MRFIWVILLPLGLAGCGEDLVAAGSGALASGSFTSVDASGVSGSGDAVGSAGDAAEGVDSNATDVVSVSDVGASSEDAGSAPADVAPPSDLAASDSGAPPADAGAPPDVPPSVDEGPPPPDEGPPAPVCPPGLAGCADGMVFACAADGSAFELLPCDEGLVCFEGACLSCGTAADCAPGEQCVDHECAVAPLQITSLALPTGLVGAPYGAQLLATGGTPPLEWSTAEALPGGLSLTSEGFLEGAPLEAGEWSVGLLVTDSVGAVAEATLTLEVVEGALVITTPSPLPGATEGEPYSVLLEADGGEPPYFFGSLDPLPPGLVMTPDGGIAGTPTVDGLHVFTARAFDNGLPTLSTARTFELNVGLAPLAIVAEQQVDIFVAQVITLPLIIVADGLPIPYSAPLEAVGGKKPYTWTEQPVSDLWAALVPGGGLPDGLTLGSDGVVSGAVTDPELVITTTIPFTQIELSGFFFEAEVADSQDPPETQSALFIIPTVPPAP